MVVGRVLDTSADTERTATRVALLVEDVLRGEVSSPVMTIRRPGVQPELLTDDQGSRPSLVVPGLPSFRVADRVLLFLGAPTNGTYPLHQLTLGAFFRRPTELGSAAVRRDAGATYLGANGLPLDPSRTRPLVRSWQAFVEWIRQQDPDIGAVSESTAYHLPSDVEIPSTVDADFTFLGGSAVRWFTFDDGGTVNFRAHSSGLAGATVDVFDLLLRATRSWNRDDQSLIRLAYAGTTNATSGLRSNDGVSAVLWDDPNGEIDGTFVCGVGGVLGLGGGFTLGTGTFANGTALRLIEGDIVVNDGAGCFFDGAGGLDGEEILGHELGHTLGLGHTTVQPQQSLMRSSAHGDGRGARLGPDDRSGIRFLYPDASTGGSGTVGTVADTVAISEAAPNVTVQVQRIGGAAGDATVAFQLIGESATADEDFVAQSGTLQWGDGQEGVRNVVVTLLQDSLPENPETLLVRLQNANGASLGSDRTRITIVDDDGGSGAGASVEFSAASTQSRESDAPVEIFVGRVGSTNAAAAVGVRVRGGSARRNQDYSFVDTTLQWPPGDDAPKSVTLELLVDEEIEDVETIVLELHDPSSGLTVGTRDRHVVDLLEAVAPGPCVAGSQTLCLVGGRFRVDAQFTTAQGTNASASAELLTDDTGYFWFFDEDNVELTTKVLDACGIAQRYWFFAGGLTNVEVRIRVVDTLRDATRVYISAPGQAFQPIQDTDAFATCP